MLAGSSRRRPSSCSVGWSVKNESKISKVIRHKRRDGQTERERERTAHTLNIKLYTHYLGSIRHKLKLGLRVTYVYIVSTTKICYRLRIENRDLVPENQV